MDLGFESKINFIWRIKRKCKSSNKKKFCAQIDDLEKLSLVPAILFQAEFKKISF